jgi:hypothetical protein
LVLHFLPVDDARIARRAIDSKTTDAEVSLQICESALAELAKHEARIRKERRERYKYPRKPEG